MSDTDQLLRQVLERLDRMEARLDAIQSKTPALIELAASSAEFAWDQATAAGVDPIESGQVAGAIALEAGKLENLRTVERALKKTHLLNKTLDAVEALEADGTLDHLIQHGTALAPSLAGVLQKPAFQNLVTSASADDKTLDTAQAATAALIETQQQGFQPLGLFGQLRMLGDGDVQKAIGFTLAIAKRFGQRLPG